MFDTLIKRKDAAVTGTTAGMVGMPTSQMPVSMAPPQAAEMAPPQAVAPQSYAYNPANDPNSAQLAGVNWRNPATTIDIGRLQGSNDYYGGETGSQGNFLTEADSALTSGWDEGSLRDLAAMGFTGNPYEMQGGSSSVNTNAVDQIDGTARATQQFQDFLNQRGYQQQLYVTPDMGTSYARFVDGSGNQVGNSRSWSNQLGLDDAFLYAMMAAGVFGGAAAAGVGASGAGAGAAEGAGGTTAAAGTASANAQLLSAEQLAQYNSLAAGLSEGGGVTGATGGGVTWGATGGLAGAGGGATAGLSSADTAALYGNAGYGAGGTGSATAGGGGLSGWVGQVAGGDYSGAASGALDWAGSTQGLGTIGSLANGLIGANSASNALTAQTSASREANQLALGIYNQQRNDWAPYRALGTQAVGQYANLLAHPDQVMNDPGVAWQRDQGVQALDRSAASRGNLYSGSQIKAATRYGQDYSSTALDNALGRYARAGQLGATGTAGTTQAAGAYGQTAGNNITGLGNATAANALFTGQNYQNALNQALGFSTYSRG